MTTPLVRRGSGAHLRCCTVCGTVRIIRTASRRRAAVVTASAVVCKPCRDVGADLVRAMGLPPDARHVLEVPA